MFITKEKHSKKWYSCVLSISAEKIELGMEKPCNRLKMQVHNRNHQN